MLTQEPLDVYLDSQDKVYKEDGEQIIENGKWTKLVYCEGLFYVEERITNKHIYYCLHYKEAFEIFAIEEKVREYYSNLDSQEEDDSKERFDAVFSCDCENCDGYIYDVIIVPRHGCGGDEDVCSRLCPIPVQEQVQYQCECECHQKPEINIEFASWDKPNGYPKGDMMKIEIDESDFIVIIDALTAAHTHHVHRDQMNAKLHLAKKTRWSALTNILASALNKAVTICNDAIEGYNFYNG